MAQQSRSGPAPERLSSGSAASVLVVDFQPFATGRRLGELLAADAGQQDLAVFQLEPARDLVGRGYQPLERLAAEYAEEFRHEDATPVTTVLGYCSGALLALRIAERLAAHRQVSVVLLRPSCPDLDAIAGMLAAVRSELRASAGGLPELGGEPSEALAGIEQVLHADLRALAEGYGLDPDSGPLTELLERYRGWFGYLLAVRDGLRDRRVPELEPLLLLGESDSADLPFLPPGGYRCQRVRLPDDDAQATEQLAREVTRHLRRPG
jgi:hypothetical protein